MMKNIRTLPAIFGTAMCLMTGACSGGQDIELELSDMRVLDLDNLRVVKDGEKGDLCIEKDPEIFVDQRTCTGKLSTELRKFPVGTQFDAESRSGKSVNITVVSFDKASRKMVLKVKPK